MWRPPFLPNSEVGLPSLLDFLTIREAVLRRFGSFIGANLHVGGDPHTLQLGADRERTVQGEPDEGAHLAKGGAVPNSGKHLGVRGVVEVQLLDEGADDRDFGYSPRFPIAPLGRVSEERCVPQWGKPLLVPFSQVPWEAFDEASLEDPEKGGFGKN